MQFSRCEYVTPQLAGDRIRQRSESLRAKGRALKAEQCSPDERSIAESIVLRETLVLRAAQPKLKHFGLGLLIRT